MSGQLTLVGTPIGNLSDLSPRAQEALRDCDAVAAEDTRVTLRLLNAFGLKKPLVSYHEHNKEESGRRLCARMQAGEHIVLVTDAGMPAISDPGEALVALCHAEGIPVRAVPGPTAVATAVALSGLPSGRFTFEGFLSVNKPGRREHLRSLQNETRTMVFYEAPHKLLTTLRDFYAAFGDRRIALCRELTKIYEETVLTTLSAAIRTYEAEPPRGEFVLVLEGAREVSAAAPSATWEEAVAWAGAQRDAGMRASEAAREAAARFGYTRQELYRALTQEDYTPSTGGNEQ